VTSLRRTGFEGRICFVAGGYRAEDLDELAALVDVVHHVEAQYIPPAPLTLSALRWVRNTRRVRRIYPALFASALAVSRRRGSLERWRSLEYHLEGLQSLRYRHYIDLVEEAPNAEYVMVTDVRDVLFQKDPFAEPVTGLELFLEDPAIRIGTDPFNTRWIIDLYGKPTADEFRGKVASCSGTTIGSRDAMLAYLRAMWSEIARHHRPLGPRDQAIHNVLALRSTFPHSAIIENRRGRVLTMGGLRAPQTNHEGYLINEDGSIPPVIHQWDRHGPLVPSLPPFRPLFA
jgi:hypothetical protein